jgi:hypothetical protein
VFFLDESRKGDKITICSPENKECSSIKKRREPEDNNVQQLLAHGKEMLKIMTDAAIDRKQQIKIMEASKLNKQKRLDFLARIELVKSLGDKDELKELRKEAKTGKNNNSS